MQSYNHIHPLAGSFAVHGGGQFPLNSPMASATTDGFNIAHVIDSFRKCSEDEEGLVIDKYLEGYLGLYRFFQIMGSVFSFVASDVHDKIHILEGYRGSQTIGENYRTIEGMVNYERDNDLLTSSVRLSGSRTLLRLHRALEFTSCLMRALGRASPSDSSASIAQECYRDTLSKYHPWLVQKGAQLAMYTLPTRDNLVKKLYDGDVASEDAKTMMEKLADSCDRVYNMTQKIYVQYDLLDLP